MIRDLIEAAKLAREATPVHDTRRVVEVLITEEGLIIRGRYSDARHAFGASEEVRWSELEGQPRLAGNAVRLVVRRIEERCEDAGVAPVRGTA
jgi:hypothetical protein